MDQLDILKDKQAICLTDDQVRHIYKKVEAESIVNIDTMKKEIEADKLDTNNDIDRDEVNLYHEHDYKYGRRGKYNHITNRTMVNTQ